MDIVCLVETHLRHEDKKKIKVKGFDVFEVRRADAEGDLKGGGIAVLARQKDGIIFKMHSPKIVDPECKFVDKERLWVTYDSVGSRTAVCAVYLGFQATDDRHGDKNDKILKVLAEEIFWLRGQRYRIVLTGDFNSWVGSDLAAMGIPGNTRAINKNGKRFLGFLEANNLVHVNGACRTAGDWGTRVSTGLWTRHSHDLASSSVIDYVVISKEYLPSVVSMEIDQDGLLGGSSDHNFIVTRLTDEFVQVDRRSQMVKKAGWNITDDQDWTAYGDKVKGKVRLVSGCLGGYLVGGLVWGQYWT
jgi:exonuclease III